MNLLRTLFLLLLPATLVAQRPRLNGLYREGGTMSAYTFHFYAKDSFYFSQSDVNLMTGGAGKGTYRLRGNVLTLRFRDGRTAAHLDTPDTLLDPHGDSVRLHLQVVNEGTGESVSYATLVVNRNQKTAFLTDASGRAYLSRATKPANDTIIASAVGFVSRSVTASGIAGTYHLRIGMTGGSGTGPIGGRTMRFRIEKRSSQRLVLLTLREDGTAGRRIVLTRTLTAREKQKAGIKD